MKLKRNKAIEIVILLIALAYPAGWLMSELRWASVNNPEGKFTNVSEYLAQPRRPSRVTNAEKDGALFFIAYSKMDYWLAVPSGPAAYVFDDSGEMIELSADTGDDADFQRKWTLPKQESSVEELRLLR